MKQQLISFLYEALGTEKGLIVRSDAPLLLRTRLYAERRKDPMLDVLSFVLSPTHPDTDLWIVRRIGPEVEL